MPSPPEIADVLFEADAPHGISLALVVLHRGEVVLERYGVQPDTIFGPGGPVDADTTLISWSVAKSITHAAVGILVGEGRLDVNAPAAVPAWHGTEKAGITVQHLLEMRSGLLWVEDYVDDSISHCLEMLYGTGAQDMAAYAAALPLIHQPGTCWNYSSGSTNIVARIVGDILGGRHAMEQFLHERLFAPTAMTSATATFDEAGTFVGSSYVHATARDFARFGELYRRDGTIDGTIDGVQGVQVVPAGWRDHARTFVATEPDGEFDYGRHWWLWRELPGSLACHGFEGQYVIVVPDRELVVVHLGKSPAERRQPLTRSLRELIDAFPRTA